MLSTPLNLPKWFVRHAYKTKVLVDPIDCGRRLEENSHLLKPPINNYCVYNDDVTVMVRNSHLYPLIMLTTQ